jgi:hypothetical protein
MSNPELHHKITYVEFTTPDIERTKKFYSTVFGWTFKDWGPEYASFHGGGIEGGFLKLDEQGTQSTHPPLIVLYSTDLKATEAAIVAAGGSIVAPPFEFPGGWRFHFSDGVGNVLAVWSE